MCQGCTGWHLFGLRCGVPNTKTGTRRRSGWRRSPTGNVRGCSPRTNLLPLASSCPRSRTGTTLGTFGSSAGTAGSGWTSGTWRTCWRTSTCLSRATGGSRRGAAGGRCSSGIDVGVRQGAVSNPPVVCRVRRRLALRHRGGAAGAG